MGVINGLVDFKLAAWKGLCFANILVLSVAFFMEKYVPRKTILRKTLVFTLKDPKALKNHHLLHHEIKQATDIDPIKAEVQKLNKIKNEVTVLVTYEAN